MNIVYSLYNITAVHKEEVQELIQKNVHGKLDSYLKGLSNDAWKDLTVKIERNKKGKYIGSFILCVDGKFYVYKTNSEWFRILSDLVNHSFDRFKEQLSHKK